MLGQESSADELARRHFDSGVAYLHESDYESALKEFQKAFKLSGRAAILVNVATVYERTSNVDAAISALEQYLALDPKGEHAETVKVRIANLEKRRAAQQPAQQTPVEPAPAAAQPAPTPAVAFSGTGRLAVAWVESSSVTARGEAHFERYRLCPLTQDDLEAGP